MLSFFDDTLISQKAFCTKQTSSKPKLTFRYIYRVNFSNSSLFAGIMASEAKDETNPEHINLKVMGQDGNIVQFKIKKHTALKKLMATYCERAGLALQVSCTALHCYLFMMF